MRNTVAVLLVDGQLGALAWSFAQAAPGARLAAISMGTGGSPHRAKLLAGLRGSALLAGELLASYPGGSAVELGAETALDLALGEMGFDAAVFLAGGVSEEHDDRALECAAAAQARGCDTLLAAEMQDAAANSRQQLSERTLTLLDRLQEPVTVALPAGIRSPVGRELREGLRSVFESSARQSQLALGVDRPARIARHDWRRAPVDLVGFAGARVALSEGTPSLLQQPLLYASALAAGSVLAELMHEEDWH